MSDLLDGLAPLVLINGERGSGKSVAAAAWARASTRRGAWLLVDDTVRTRRAFWTRVFGFVEDATADGPAQVRTPAVVHDDERRTIAGWAHSIDDPLVLVVDGIDELGPDVVDDLHWVAGLASGLHIVAIGRSPCTTSAPDTRSIMHHSRAGVSHVDIDGRTLRFNASEVSALFTQAGVVLSEEAARAVAHETTGLPIGVAGIARALAVDGVRSIGAGPALRRYVDASSRSLVAEAVARLERPQRDVLARVALLGSATADEAAHVAGVDRDDVRRILAAAEAVGLGWWVDDHDRGRSFLFPVAIARALATPVRSDPRAAGIVSRAAHTRAARGEIFEAVSLAIDARDFRSGVSIGAGSLVELMTEHTEPLLAQLSAIPLSQLSEHPLVVLFIGQLHAQSARGRLPMLAYYAWADHLARTRGATARTADRAVLLTVRAVALRLAGRSSWAASTTRKALAALEAAPREDAEALGLLRPLVLGQAVMGLFAGGDIQAARDMAVRAATADGSVERARQHAWAKSAFIEAVCGDIVRARERVELAHRLDSWPDGFFAVPTAVAEAMIALEDLDPAAADDALTRIGPRLFRTEFWLAGAIIRVYSDLVGGRAASAVASVRSMLSGHSTLSVGRPARAGLDDLVALAHLAAGEIAEARAVLRRSSGSGARRSPVSALLRLASDEPSEAIAVATEGLGGPDFGPRDQALLMLVRAAAECRLGYVGAATRDVEAVLEILSATGLRTPWALIPARDRDEIDAIARSRDGIAPRLLEELARVPVVLPRIPAVVPLTARERQVMRGVAAGATNVVIAHELGVSPNTVRKQRASAYRKLGASTREKAIASALERGILDFTS